MKLKHVFLTVSAIFLLGSCVGEDIITDESLLTPNLSIERELRSVAIDENPRVNLRLTIGNEVVDLNTTDIFDVKYSSSLESVFTVSDKGEIQPQENSLGKEAIFRVEITEKNVATPREANVEDVIKIGIVTLTESEAKAIENDSEAENIDKIINSGFAPKVTITNRVKTIDVAETKTIPLNPVFQNKKKKVQEVTFTYTSSDESILVVNAEGIATPVSKGEVNVTAVTSFEGEDVSDTIAITVSEETKVEETPIEEEIGGGNSDILGSGTFIGDNGYTVNGGFEILTQEDGQKIVKLNAEFSAGGVPDLVIYLSNAKKSNAGAPALAENANTGGGLPRFNTSGEQSIVIPNNINPDDFQFVLLYCRRFNVNVGYGTINR